MCLAVESTYGISLPITSLPDDNITPSENSSGLSSEDLESIGVLTLPILLAYFIISIFGVAGNVMVIIAVATLSRLRNVQNIYVVNLCIADILLGTNASLIILDVYDQNWAVENGLCDIVSFMTFIPPIAVVGCTVCIAKNRYDAIVNAQHHYTYVNCPRTAVLMSIIVWGVSLTLGLPILIGWVTSRAGLFCACCIYFKENQQYTLFLTVLVYVIPNIIIIFCYVSIFCFVRQSRNRVMEHSQQVSQKVASNTARTDIKLAVQFIILFLIFNICFLPATIVFWTMTMDDSLNNQTIRNGTTMLFAVNIIANPIGYFCMNSFARREIKKALVCSERNNSDTESGMVESQKARRRNTTKGSPSTIPANPPRKLSSTQSPIVERNILDGLNGIKALTIVMAAPTSADPVNETEVIDGQKKGPEIRATSSLAIESEDSAGIETTSSHGQEARGKASFTGIRRAESLDVNIVYGEV